VTHAVSERASFLDTVKTVLYGAIGVRRRGDHERARIRPAYLVMVAIVFLILFVLTLRFIVGLVVS
jgi:cell division protein FtsB